MKIYKTQQEVEADIKDGVLAIDGDVKFKCSISISASIKVNGNINAWDIDAENINAWNINAVNIDAGDIDAENINARDINAGYILYYAFCCVYNSIKCISIKARRDKHQEPICLDGKLEIKPKEDDMVEIRVEGKTKKISRISARELNLIN